MEDYKVLYDTLPAGLAYEVKAKLREGWSVHGGVLISASDGKTMYAQAVVKNQKSEKKVEKQDLCAYWIVSEGSSYEVSSKVREYLKAGWSLVGGCSVAKDGAKKCYAQALFKEHTEKPQ